MEEEWCRAALPQGSRLITPLAQKPRAAMLFTTAGMDHGAAGVALC